MGPDRYRIEAACDSGVRQRQFFSLCGVQARSQGADRTGANRAHRHNAGPGLCDADGGAAAGHGNGLEGAADAIGKEAGGREEAITAKTTKRP